MKLYLAARFERQQEIRKYRAILVKAGFKITSSWLNTKMVHTNTACLTWAERDLEDIDKSDAIVLWTENPNKGFKRGGRHFEFGYACGTGKKCYIIGKPENIFHHLPVIGCFKNVQDFIEKVKP